MQPVRWSKMDTVFVDTERGIRDNGYLAQAHAIASKPHEYMQQDVAKARRVLVSGNRLIAVQQLDQNVANMRSGS